MLKVRRQVRVEERASLRSVARVSKSDGWRLAWVNTAWLVRLVRPGSFDFRIMRSMPSGDRSEKVSLGMVDALKILVQAGLSRQQASLLRSASQH